MYDNEINRRRTFAIISHPDAGKTTLTEKFLLYGGAINLAGTVKGRKAKRMATSDWMEIEKERGISVTSSAMQFEYKGKCINILDTPGHQDFSEDTYRTLMAADQAVMVIDSAKGVEPQTIKLFKVCTMRHIPIFTFINKLDREAKDVFELLDEIEKVLGIKVCPINYPISCGKTFKGIYDRRDKMITTYVAKNAGAKELETNKYSIEDLDLVNKVIGEEYINKLKADLDLLDGATDAFDKEKVDKGELTPVFFGSALSNFGVGEFLDSFIDMTLPPLKRSSNLGVIEPTNDDFSGFVFKIQANMNKAHRDRIAFMRICSGKFEKGIDVNINVAKIHPTVVNIAPYVVSSLLIFLLGAIVYINLIFKYIIKIVNGHLIILNINNTCLEYLDNSLALSIRFNIFSPNSGTTSRNTNKIIIINNKIIELTLFLITSDSFISYNVSDVLITAYIPLEAIKKPTIVNIPTLVSNPLPEITSIIVLLTCLGIISLIKLPTKSIEILK